MCSVPNYLVRDRISKQREDFSLRYIWIFFKDSPSKAAEPFTDQYQNHRLPFKILRALMARVSPPSEIIPKWAFVLFYLVISNLLFSIHSFSPHFFFFSSVSAYIPYLIIPWFDYSIFFFFFFLFCVPWSFPWCAFIHLGYFSFFGSLSSICIFHFSFPFCIDNRIWFFSCIIFYVAFISFVLMVYLLL